MFEWIKGNGSKSRRDYGSFKFSLKSQPEIIDSSSTISLIAYSNGFGNAAIPCVYKWAIIKNGVKIQRPQFKGNMYKCEPGDVGGVIEAEVKSTDMEYGGTAIVQFNPVQIDPNIKSQVQQSLIGGHFSTSVHVIQGIEERQCQIKISEQSIKIRHNYSQSSFQFQYQLNEPQTQCLTKSSSGVVVNFTDKHENQLRNFIGALFDDPFKNISGSIVKISTGNKDIQNKSVQKCIELKFPTHDIRDVFLFVWKAFATNKQLKKPSTITNQLSVKSITSHNNLDYLSQIQSLKKQLLRMSQLNKQYQIQKSKSIHQIQILKEEIKSIIKNYTVFIEEKFQLRTEYSNNSIFFIGENNQPTKKYKNLENKNNHLNSRIYALTKEIDTIRFQPLKLQSARQSGYHSPSNQCVNSTKIRQNCGNSICESPFSKKKTSDESQDLINLLDDCDASRISYLSEISSIHGNLQLEQLNRINENEKKQLQRKLQRSYQKIDKLENQLWKAKEELNFKNQKSTHSAVNFTSHDINNQTVQNTTSIIYNKPLIQTNHNKKLTLNNDIRQLKKITIHNQKSHTRNLNEEFDKVYRRQIEDRNMFRSQSVYQQSNCSSVSIIKTEKKDPCFYEVNNSFSKEMIKQEQKGIYKLQSINQQLLSEKQSLVKQNQSLSQQNKQLISEIQLLRKSQPQINKLQTRIKSMQQEIQMYQKNLDVLNRSQQLSNDSNTFNDEQIEILKRQNDFLTMQNQKITKACEKYMAEAKQSSKLRLQLTKMRSRTISEKYC